MVPVYILVHVPLFEVRHTHFKIKTLYILIFCPTLNLFVLTRTSTGHMGALLFQHMHIHHTVSLYLQIAAGKFCAVSDIGACTNKQAVPFSMLKHCFRNIPSNLVKIIMFISDKTNRACSFIFA